MEVNKIQEELARLIELVDGWAGSHDVPGIERDLVLDKLKKLYEAIRFANFDEGDSSASASVAAQQSVAEVAPVSEISIDLDDLLAEPVRDSLPEPAAMPEGRSPRQTVMYVKLYWYLQWIRSGRMAV